MGVKRTNITTLTHTLDCDQKTLFLQAGSHYTDVPPTLVKSSALVKVRITFSNASSFSLYCTDFLHKTSLYD